jgi:hypothetical protein
MSFNELCIWSLFLVAFFLGGVLVFDFLGRVALWIWGKSRRLRQIERGIIQR